MTKGPAFETKAIVIRRETIVFQRKGPALQRKTITLQRETIVFQQKAIALQRETITFQQKAIGTGKKGQFSVKQRIRTWVEAREL